MTLEEIFKFIEAREAGKRSASRMRDNVEIAAARSSLYRQLFESKAPGDSGVPTMGSTGTKHTGNSLNVGGSALASCGVVTTSVSSGVFPRWSNDRSLLEASVDLETLFTIESMMSEHITKVSVSTSMAISAGVSRYLEVPTMGSISALD